MEKGLRGAPNGDLAGARVVPNPESHLESNSRAPPTTSIPASSPTNTLDPEDALGHPTILSLSIRLHLSSQSPSGCHQQGAVLRAPEPEAGCPLQEAVKEARWATPVPWAGPQNVQPALALNTDCISGQGHQPRVSSVAEFRQHGDHPAAWRYQCLHTGCCHTAELRVLNQVQWEREPETLASSRDALKGCAALRSEGLLRGPTGEVWVSASEPWGQTIQIPSRLCSHKPAHSRGGTFLGDREISAQEIKCSVP